MLSGHRGPVIDPVMWKRMYKGIEVYKGRVFADKAAVLPSQVREKIEYMIKRKEHLTITGAFCSIFNIKILNTGSQMTLVFSN